MAPRLKRTTSAATLKTPLRASPPKPSASQTDEDPDENYTPDKDFAPLYAEFQFTLDPCATAESAKCPKFYTKAQDGLAQSWRGERVWMNPPYSRIAPWLGKAAQEVPSFCSFATSRSGAVSGEAGRGPLPNKAEILSRPERTSSPVTFTLEK